MLAQLYQSVWSARIDDLQVDRATAIRLLREKYFAEERDDKDLKRYIESELMKDTVDDANQKSGGNRVKLGDLNLLRKQLYLEQGLACDSDMRRIDALDNMSHPFRVDRGLPDDSEVIKNFFDRGIDLWLLAEQAKTDRTFDRRRLAPIIEAAQLIQKECKEELRVVDGKVDVTETIWRAVHTRLDNLATQLGGGAILENLFNNILAGQYSKELKRYEIYRTKCGTYQYKGQQLPYRYIIQIAMKHLFQKPKATNCQPALYAEFLKLARALLTVLDICDPDPIADYTLSTKDFPVFVFNNALYEALCIPPQYDPSFCVFLIEQLYRPFLMSGEGRIPFLGHTLPTVLNWCMSQKPCSFFKISDIRRDTGLGEKQIGRVLDCFSQPHECVNENFNSAVDESNLDKYPLVSGPNGQYFQLCPEFSGYAFCERVYTMLKDKFPLVDRKLGPAVERCVAALLDEKKIPYLSGEYKERKQIIGECDFVLEDKRRIMFLEIKKCPLPQTFIQGDDVEIFHSLADGMIKAQIQALKHRDYLEKNGQIVLYSGDVSTAPCGTIKLDGRKVITVSMCLPEYAFLANSVPAKGMMQCLAVGTLSTIDPARSDRLRKINELASQLQAHIRGCSVTDLNRYFHYCCFRSVQQLWFILNRSANVDEIITRLSKDCAVALNVMDFYALSKLW